MLHPASPYGAQILEVFHPVAGAQKPKFQPHCAAPRFFSDVLITASSCKVRKQVACFIFQILHVLWDT